MRSLFFEYVKKEPYLFDRVHNFRADHLLDANGERTIFNEPVHL
jgi:hypothetical protein